MNLRLTTILAVVISAAISGWLVPASEWAATAKSILTVLAILAAAILVRLNRGMPTIDWSKVDSDDRVRLVEDIKKLAREYGVTLVFVGFTLVLFLILDRTIGDTPLAVMISSAPNYISTAISAATGAISSFVLIRIAYVVWRDIDIVDLQAGVISQAANAEKVERHNNIADAIAKSGVINPHQQGTEPKDD
jgi:MFS family permease